MDTRARDAYRLKFADMLADGEALVRSGAALAGRLLGTLADVDDAPSDGTTYGRNNGAWAAAGAAGDTPTVVTSTSTVAANTCRFVAPALTISTGDLTLSGDLVIGG